MLPQGKLFRQPCLYVVNFRTNRGLAKGFMAGLDACLRNGADIIVNTDADDQYCGDDIEKLVRPILEEKADIVIGERPIDDTEHFSPLKKKLQHFGSWTVRVAYFFRLNTSTAVLITAGSAKISSSIKIS